MKMKTAIIQDNKSKFTILKNLPENEIQKFQTEAAAQQTKIICIADSLGEALQILNQKLKDVTL